MHRSGTSALCAALQASGASFGTSLLDPMAGVNDEGFWEDQAVVDINERLLQQLGLSWYTVPVELQPVDWSQERFTSLRAEATARLGAGFGEAAVEAVKDPRFCLTLPFWLGAAAVTGLATQVCVIGRAPLEVAASLQRRDGFPLGYGLRLYLAYRAMLSHQAPADAVYIRYDDLLADPSAVIAQIAAAGLPLEADIPELGAAVRPDLRHQAGDGGGGLLQSPPAGDDDLCALATEIEREYPTSATLRSLAMEAVARGQQLASLGQEHSRSLCTLDQRDNDVERLAGELAEAVATVAERDRQIQVFDRRLSEAGAHLQQALATLDERDEQIREFDHRLTEIGRMHGDALAYIESREEHLQRVLNTPAMGFLFRMMWLRESR
jgi:hypothetical protein